MSLGASDCERIGEGLLLQPVNALSSLAFVAAGVWVLSGAGGRKSLGWISIATGIGSFLFHGPQPSGSRALHDSSALALVTLAAVTATREIRRSSMREFALRRRAALMLAALGVAAYAAGRSGSPLCDPVSPLQLHGVWHALAAASVASLARERAGGPRRFPVLG